MTPLAQLEANADPARAAEMLAYHKAPRRYLGLVAAQIDTLTDQWRADLALDDRIALAAELWSNDIHEARVAAAKLLTQARLRPDAAAWALIQTWVPDLDGRTLADLVCIAGQKRLVADPARLDTVAGWVTSPHLWTRRATLMMTLPWTKQNFPKPADLAVRDRVLGWCAVLAADPDATLQTAVAGWLRDLSRHDPSRAQGFLADHGDRLKPFARLEAGHQVGPGSGDEDSNLG